MSEKTTSVRKERITQYLENMQRQLAHLDKLKVPDKSFFEEEANFERTNAIRYSLACAIEDVCRIALHLTVALGLCRVRETPAEAILALGRAKIIPPEFAEKVKGMPAFRNRLIHDYLPNKFDAERLFDAINRLEEFREFSRFITAWIEENITSKGT